jgi:hypothetical protein
MALIRAQSAVSDFIERGFRVFPCIPWLKIPWSALRAILKNDVHPQAS